MLTNKNMMLEATDIIRTVADGQKGLKKTIGKLLNKVCYLYYKSIPKDERNRYE